MKNEKKAYIFRENGGTIVSNWFVLSYDGRASTYSKPVTDMIQEVRGLRKKGYDIDDSNNVPIEEIMKGLGRDPEEYRVLNDKDREYLQSVENDLEGRIERASQLKENV